MNFGPPQLLMGLEVFVVYRNEHHFRLTLRVLQGLFQDEAHSGIHQTQIEHLPTRRFSAEQSTNMGSEHKV